jgi:hypothetical protein
MRRLTVVYLPAVAATALAVLTGCAQPAAPGGPPPATTVPVTTAPAPTQPPTSEPPTSEPPTSQPPPSAPSEPAGTPSGSPVAYDGMAVPGVEPGCVVFTTGGRHYLLLGAKSTVPLNVPIRVRGVVLTGVLSYCQQGTPFRVLEINRR